MTQRLRIALVLLICTTLIAAACGGEVADSDAGGSRDSEAAPTTAPEPDSGSGGESDSTEPTGAATGTSTDEPDESTPDDTSTTEQAPEPDDSTDTGSTDTVEEVDAGPPPNIYDDPRDGIFDEFQATFDRGDHPFTQLDAFCHAHDPAPNRAATLTPASRPTPSLWCICGQQARGPSSPRWASESTSAMSAEMFDTFTAVVNEQCGGVRGRMIEMHTIDVAGARGFAVDQDRNAACIQAIEDLDGVILLNSSGFQGSANLCIVEEHETAFISTQGQSGEFMQRGQDRLISLSPTLEESLSWLALDLLQRGELDGKTIGVAAPDTPGQFEAVEAGLVDVLESNGVDVAVFDAIGCGGGTFCLTGIVESVRRMRDAGIDVFFNVLNIVSVPSYIGEMSSQGFEPGDVQFYASDFNSQAGELVSSKIVAFGGEQAGALYNGALIVDEADTGHYRLERYQPPVFNEMCNDTYGTNSASGANHESAERLSGSGSSAYGMTVSVCVIMRIALRALYDAGDNPTRADVYAALASLGPVDNNEMLPSTVRPGKTQIPDVLHTLRFEYPCTKPAPFGEEQICIFPIDEYRPAPR